MEMKRKVLMFKMTMSEEKLRELYYNPKSGFLSLNKRGQRAKEEHIPVSYNDVKNFLEQQKPDELHKQVVRPK
jgi:hypothetical protein